MDAIGDARAFVAERHPSCRVALLAGSVASGRALAGSDLDIVLIYEDGHPNYAETLSFRGWLVESFIHSPQSLEWWYRREADELAPVIAHMCATGIVLQDDGSAAAVQEAARLRLASPPAPLSQADRDLRRYSLSADLDDLTSGTSISERFMLEAEVFRQSAELVMRESGAWLGHGKWLVRRLVEVGGIHADALVRWAGSETATRTELAEIARAVLDASGGYLQQGFLRGERSRSTVDPSHAHGEQGP
jgi:hypothetical protein